MAAANSRHDSNAAAASSTVPGHHNFLLRAWLCSYAGRRRLSTCCVAHNIMPISPSNHRAAPLMPRHQLYGNTSNSSLTLAMAVAGIFVGQHARDMLTFNNAY